MQWIISIVGCLFIFSAQAQLLKDIQELSADNMQGRKTGSDGTELARQFIAQRFEKLQLGAFNTSYLQMFNYGFGQHKTGTNVVGYQRGCTYPEHYIVVTAHYDHLGNEGKNIFHGADDNASGVAALLELASRLSERCSAYSYIFIATDAEENGLYGSKAFVSSPSVPLGNITLNLNLDMIGRPDRRGRLYLTGAKRYPALIALLAQQFSYLQYLPHRGPGQGLRSLPRYDWPNASDHGPFHRAGIPYLFFGGQDHRDYHTPNDTWQNIEPEFLEQAMQAIWHTVQWLEQQAPQSLQAPN